MYTFYPIHLITTQQNITVTVKAIKNSFSSPRPSFIQKCCVEFICLRKTQNIQTSEQLSF